LISRGYLHLVYGGSDVGTRLVCDERIGCVHITGSHTTHDSIVWGPPGPDRTRRIRENDPVLKKPITSELGNVGPVAIVPYSYTDAELRCQARNIATMVANNAGFNCNAAHLIITSSRWPQREQFLDLLAQVLERIPPRKPYYPGARERYESLTRGQRRVQYVGHSAEDSLPWAVIRDVDAQDASCRLFTTEPFCALISETGLSSSDPVEFLSAATSFMNDTLWGTLNACIVLPPALERNVGVKNALDRAIVELRYGTIGINTWPAVAYGSATLPWGGHRGGTLQSVQSGSGWVHNTFMLDGVEKSVIRGPLVPRPTPVWFADKPLSASFASRLVRFQSAPGWLKVPRLVLAALKE
jgi:acyl-CoA reductase-like NAD-dependent aldehyde dehydrogenase